MLADNKDKLINAGLFQGLWFSAVYGSAHGLIWPCILFLAALMWWQLAPSRRADSDIKLIGIALLIGLIIDSMWINMDVMKFTDQTPINWLSPAWILALWVGFALTINHSMSWLKIHPLIPALLGMISAPLSYYAGKKFGAVEYNHDTLLVSAYIGIAWCVALPLIVKFSDEQEAKKADS